MQNDAVKAPKVFLFNDYRAFLRELFAYLKTHKGLSMRQIASEAKISEGYLPMVVAGERNLSEKQIQRLRLALGLSSTEAGFLAQLARFEDAKKYEDKVEALKRILSFSEFRSSNEDELVTFKYLSKCYNVAIRELAETKDFVPDATWIKQRLSKKVLLSEINASLEFLLAHGFLVRDGQGRIKSSGKRIHCSTGILKTALANFHRSTLEILSQGILDVPREERNVSAHTCAFAASQIPEVQKILEEALDKIIALSDQSKDAEQVYHFSLVALPLTKKRKEAS